MVDVMFKFIFGANERKSVTLDFLNAVLSLEGEQKLKDIQFLDRELVPESDDEKMSRLDIFGITDTGSQVDIEVQIVNRKNMEKRTLYYWSRLYQRLERGKDYQELHQTIAINILDFSLLPQKDFHSKYGIYNLETGHRLTDDLEIHFLEVPKWEVKNIKEMKRLDRWLGYLSRKLTDEEREELAMKEDAIREAMKAEKIFTQDDIKWREYEQREAAIRDYRSDMRAWREEGREEGIMSVAKKLLEKNMDKAQIAEVTGLTLSQIEELAEDK